MAYVEDKRAEKAAVAIQRIFRAIRARTQFRALRQGHPSAMETSLEHLAPSEEDRLKVAKHQAEYNRIKNYILQTNKDTMFDKIPEERQRAIVDEIVRRRLGKSDAEINQLIPANIQSDFDAKYEEWAYSYAALESERE